MYSEDVLPPPLNIVSGRATLGVQMLVIKPIVDSVNKKSKTVASTTKE